MKTLTKFEIKGLHGVFSYRLPQEGRKFDDTVILYGENGSGKTTLLRIIFHLLSAAPKRGHLTELRKIPFERIGIWFSDGSTVSAIREGEVIHSPIRYRVRRAGGTSVTYRHIPDEIRERLRETVFNHERHVAEGKIQWRRTVKEEFEAEYKRLFRDSDEAAHHEYLSALAQVAPHSYYISTERQILSDHLEVTDEQVYRQRTETRGELIASTRSTYLKQALAAGSRAIHNEVFKAANVGGADSNEVYKRLVSMLASTNLGSNGKQPDLPAVLQQLRALRVRNRSFAMLGLMPNFDMQGIFPILRNAETPNQEIIQLVIKPYIDSVNKRLDALEPVHRMIRTFLRSLNEFFSNKTITFRTGIGFRILGFKDEPLAPEQLSSGEQQLLLIFCNVLASRSGPSLFIVDEPEISLNVKWQRNLIDALRKIIAGADAQLLIATHSIELLTQHSDKVAVLAPQYNSNKAYVHDDSETND
nr:AAA family ATPase [Burkholderia sp. Ac-20365]